MRQHITEAATLTATKTGPGRALITLLTAGQGNSGTYSPEVLETAARDRVFPRGTQMHIDHYTDQELAERPEGSLRNLVGALTEDAWYRDGALHAEARIGTQWRDFVDDFGEYIGVSIYAAATITNDGVVEALHPDPFNRADFVTVPGRGGKVAAVLEAARETTVDDETRYVAAAVRTRFNGWLLDRDATYAYYATPEDDTHRVAYTLDGNQVTFTDTPVPVTRRVEYDPVNTPTTTPATPVGATENATTTQEDTMAKIEIDEQELNQLRESAGRADTLAAELQQIKDEQEAKAAEARTEAAVAAVREHFGDDAPAYLVDAAKRAAESVGFDAKAHAEAVKAAAESMHPSDTSTPTVGHTTTESRTRNTDRTGDILTILNGKEA